MDDPVRQERERLHISVGPSCNNNCIFCIEERREERFKILANQTPEDVFKMLNLGLGYNEVMFVSGEPTLNVHLPQYIRWAKHAGFDRVGLITNGRRLAYPSYAKTLILNGLDHVVISIHGHNSRLHDALTRTKGSFLQTIKGLINLLNIRKNKNTFRLSSATCVNTKNLPFICDIILFLSSFGLDDYIFNVMMPEGRGERFMKTLMPRYSDVKQVFETTISQLPMEILEKTRLLDIPFCVTESLPLIIRGHTERYSAFEMHGTCPVPSLEPMIATWKDMEGFKIEALTGKAKKYSLISKDFHESITRIKRDKCFICRYERTCPGVFETYIKHFGWGEFLPVT